jgi:hypothetical protein
MAAPPDPGIATSLIYHNEPEMVALLKLWNEAGTKPVRIADRKAV